MKKVTAVGKITVPTTVVAILAVTTASMVWVSGIPGAWADTTRLELRLLARSATQYTFNLDFYQYDRKLAITCM